jgi:YgiT-type zinc finger domain-containing protein
MDDPQDTRENAMKCSIRGCPGEYEERQIVHTERHAGDVIVIEGVPAEVCTICGDVLLRIETVRRLEEIAGTPAVPARTAPVYDYSVRASQ